MCISAHQVNIGDREQPWGWLLNTRDARGARCRQKPRTPPKQTCADSSAQRWVQAGIPCFALALWGQRAAVDRFNRVRRRSEPTMTR